MRYATNSHLSLDVIIFALDDASAWQEELISIQFAPLIPMGAGKHNRSGQSKCSIREDIPRWAGCSLEIPLLLGIEKVLILIIENRLLRQVSRSP